MGFGIEERQRAAAIFFFSSLSRFLALFVDEYLPL